MTGLADLARDSGALERRLFKQKLDAIVAQDAAIEAAQAARAARNHKARLEWLAEFYGGRS